MDAAKRRFHVPLGTPLFAGLSDEQVDSVLDRLGAIERNVPAHGLVIRQGAPSNEIGLIAAGEALVYETGADGRRNIIAEISPGDTFASSFAFAQMPEHPASVEALTDVTVVLIPKRHLVPAADSVISKPFHRFLTNLLGEVCKRAQETRQKMKVVSCVSTEERLLAFLRRMARVKKSRTFTVPLDRQALADYLCVDRCALSTVMGRLSREGRISFRKNEFTLFEPRP